MGWKISKQKRVIDSNSEKMSESLMSHVLDFSPLCNEMNREGTVIKTLKVGIRRHAWVSGGMGTYWVPSGASLENKQKKRKREKKRTVMGEGDFGKINLKHDAVPGWGWRWDLQAGPASLGLRFSVRFGYLLGLFPALLQHILFLSSLALFLSPWTEQFFPSVVSTRSNWLLREAAAR